MSVLKHVRKWVLVLAIGTVAFWCWTYWREHRFDKQIAQAARRYGLDPALVKAVVWQESRFDPDARGQAGELGLMQVRETAALEWASAEGVKPFQHTDCLDPGTNLLAGAWYLRQELRRYSQADNALPYALADYNAGRANVRKWLAGGAATNSQLFLEQIRFPATRAYIRAILRRYDHYR